MSAQDNGGPAFPVSTANGTSGHQDSANTWQYPGMTLRDYFAAHIAGHLSASPLRQENTLMDDAAYAYRLADAMLKARQA